MRVTRVLFPLLALLFAAVAETVWLAPIGFPGVVPPLTIITMFAVTRWMTPANAATVGFAVGIMLDLMPPSDVPMGISAFAFALAAFALSYWRNLTEGATILTVVAWAIAAVSAQSLRLVLFIAAGVPIGSLGAVALELIMTPIYSLMLASLLLPVSSVWEKFAAAPRQQTIFR